MTRFLTAIRIALNVRAIKCPLSWNWQEYAEF